MRFLTPTRLGLAVYAVVLMPALVGLPIRQDLPFYGTALTMLIVAVAVAAHVVGAWTIPGTGRHARACVSMIATICVTLLQLMALAALITADTLGVRFVSNLVRLDPEIIRGALVVLLAAFLSGLGRIWKDAPLTAATSSIPPSADESTRKSDGRADHSDKTRPADDRDGSQPTGSEKRARSPGNSSRGQAGARHRDRQPAHSAQAQPPTKSKTRQGVLHMAAVTIVVAITSAGLALALAPNSHSPNDCQAVTDRRADQLSLDLARTASPATKPTTQPPRSMPEGDAVQPPDRAKGSRQFVTKSIQRVPP